MESNSLLFGVLGVIVSLLLGIFLSWKLSPILNSISKDFTQQRFDEGILNPSFSSIGKFLIMLLLFAILMAPCLLCFLSAFLINTGHL